MTLTVFYSWQADTPARINRSLIESALKRALEQINADAKVVNSAREVQLDKDTMGLPGTPPIVEAIFRKIDECAVFVPDLTFVAHTEAGRPTPNANVLIEYGWALKSRGHDRIVAVMNDAFGAPSETSLPFNMRHLRWPLRYTLPDGNGVRDSVRKQLVDKLARAIRAVLDNAPVEPALERTFEETSSTSDKAVFYQKNEALATREEAITETDEKCLVRAKGPKMFLRLIPTVRIAGISPTRARDIAEAGRLEPFSLPRMGGGEWYDRNKYGAIVYRTFGDKPAIKQLTQLLKNAELWGVNDELDRIKQDTGFGVLLHGYEDAFIHTLGNYLKFAREHLHLTLPLRLVAGITGIEDFKMAAPPGKRFSGFELYGGRAVEPDVIFETTLGDWSVPPAEILSPFFEMVWEAFGLSRPEMPRQEAG